MNEKNCAFCNALFMPKEVRRKFCSPSCSSKNANAARRKFIACAICSNIFHPKKTGAECCSRSCRSILIHQRRSPEKKAMIGSKIGASIMASFPPQICSGCGADFRGHGLKFCEACRKARSLDYREKRDAKDIWKHARTKVSGRERKCVVCGYDKHVQCCHIIPVHKFPDSALLSEINADKNLILLCPNHHWELDHGLLVVPEEVESPYCGNLPLNQV